MIGLGSDKNVRELEKFWSSQSVKPPNHHFCVDFRDGHGTELTHFLSLMTHFEEGALSLFGPTRPKPAYGRQGLEGDRWVRIQLRRVHFGVDTFGRIFIFGKQYP